MNSRGKHAGKRESGRMRAYVFQTAWGWCGIKVSHIGLARVIIPDGCDRREVERMLGGTPADGRPGAVKLLYDYFAGKRPSLNIPVDLTRSSDFERAVYREVAKIPCGETASYGEIARRVGRPGAARAVGAAMAVNPVPIVIPCHRVVRADGGLGGFSSRGGTATKQKLLALEKLSTKEVRPL